MSEMLLILLVLFVTVRAGILHNVTDYNQIQDSGDSYPQFLPYPTSSGSLSSKVVLFVLGHGVEDHEVYYTHQYLVDRGATVEFGCPSANTVLSDFFKPTYVVQCVDLAEVDLNNYDAIYVPGGVPSSSAVRISGLPAKLYNFWASPTNNNKLIAIICSGNEVLIDANMLTYLPAIVGSPASHLPLEIGFQAVFQPASNYKGLDPLYSAISYLSNDPSVAFPPPGSRSHLVLGKNPAASVEFVLAVGKAWGLNEEAPPVGKGVPLNFANGRYNHKQFTVISNLNQLPSVPANPFSTSIPLPSSQNVALAISSGADFDEVNYWNSHFQQQGSTVTFICPAWVPQWKSGEVFLHTSPPAKVLGIANCTTGFDKPTPTTFDLIIVPGGLFSTGGVLRNDPTLAQLLSAHHKAGRPLVFSGTGVQMIIASRLAPGAPVAASSTVVRDLTDMGYNALLTDYTWIKDTTGKGGDIYSFFH